MIAAIKRLETRAERVEVRIAIATGLVVVGDLISGCASEQQAMVGDTPNIAARLQSLAEPGVVVVAASTRELLGGLFTFRNLGLREIKGISEPIAAWAVEGGATSESRFEAVRKARSMGFVGRKAEIEFALSRQQLAWQGHGQMVLISGEAGIGKSRIVATLSESLALGAHRRIRYQCSPYHTNSALHPFVAQLERAAGIVLQDTSEQKLDKLEAMLALGTDQVANATPLIAALLSIPAGERYPPLGLSPVQQRRQTFAALLDQLEGLARQQPVLIVCEDMASEAKQSIVPHEERMDCFVALLPCTNASHLSQAMTQWGDISISHRPLHHRDLLPHRTELWPSALFPSERLSTHKTITSAWRSGNTCGKIVARWRFPRLLYPC